MATILIYTNKTNNDLNNRNIDDVLKIFKKHNLRCENDDIASVTAKIHFNVDFGVFKAGMDAIEVESDELGFRGMGSILEMIEEVLNEETEFDEDSEYDIGNNKILFDIREEIDIASFTKEEMALIYQVKITYVDEEYEEFIKTSKESGDIVYTELALAPKEEEKDIPEGFEELYEEAYNEYYEEQFERLEKRLREKEEEGEDISQFDIEKMAKDFAESMALDWIKNEKTRRKLLRRPYLIHTLKERNEIDPIRYGSSQKYIIELLSKDGSIISKLLYKAHDIVEAELAVESDYSAISSEALEDFIEDRNFVLFAIEQKKKQGWSDLDDCFILLAAPAFNGDEEVVEAAVAVDNKEFAFASEELRADKDFIFYLLDKGYYGITPGISEELDTDEFKELLISKYPMLGPQSGQWYSPINKLGSFDELYNGIEEIIKKRVEKEIMENVLKGYKQF